MWRCNTSRWIDKFCSYFLFQAPLVPAFEYPVRSTMAQLWGACCQPVTLVSIPSTLPSPSWVRAVNPPKSTNNESYIVVVAASVRIDNIGGTVSVKTLRVLVWWQQSFSIQMCFGRACRIPECCSMMLAYRTIRTYFDVKLIFISKLKSKIRLS